MVTLDTSKVIESITPHIISNEGRAIEISIKMMSRIKHKLSQWHVAQNFPSYLCSLENDKFSLSL